MRPYDSEAKFLVYVPFSANEAGSGSGSYPQSHSLESTASGPQRWSQSWGRSPCSRRPLWWSRCSRARCRCRPPHFSCLCCRRPTCRGTGSQTLRRADQNHPESQAGFWWPFQHPACNYVWNVQNRCKHSGLSHRSSLGPQSGCCPAKPGRLMWSLMIMMSPTLKSGQIPPEAFVTSTNSTPISLKILTGNVTWWERTVTALQRREGKTINVLSGLGLKLKTFNFLFRKNKVQQRLELREELNLSCDRMGGMGSWGHRRLMFWTWKYVGVTEENADMWRWMHEPGCWWRCRTSENITDVLEENLEAGS